MENETGALRIGGYELSAKNLIVIGLILVGLFFAYVIFLKPKAQATTTASDTSSQQSGGGVAVTTDPSALGSLQTSLESLQVAAAAQTAGISGVSGQLGGIATNASNAARDAAGARTDAAAANNGINDVIYGVLPSGAPLPNSAIRPIVTPHPAPVQTGRGDSIGGPTMADYWHLANAGLGA